MTEYSGDKAFDAEMFIDLQTGKLTMDYTLNKHVTNVMASNNGCLLKNDLKKLPLKHKLWEFIRATSLMIFAMWYIGLVGQTLTYLFHKGYIKNKQYMVEHQKMMKYIIVNTHGTGIETIDAPLREHVLTVHLRSNTWISYKLEGDFETEIKTIELKRSFKKTMTFGKYECIQQSGWDLIFEFKTPPQNGKCIVEHTL